MSAQCCRQPILIHCPSRTNSTIFLLKNKLTTDLHHLAIEEKRATEMQPLIPFAQTIEAFAEDIRLVRRPDPEKAAGQLTAMVKQIEAAQKALDPQAGCEVRGWN